MSKSLMPTSKAKTAYGLLSEIAALAIEEPMRIAMGCWSVSRRDVNHGFESMPGRGFPGCGTVGCIGGWVNTLKPRGVEAEVMLGLDSDQTDELFFDNDLCQAPEQQTAKHARAVVRHIRRFQKKYRAQLLAKKVR